MTNIQRPRYTYGRFVDLHKEMWRYLATSGARNKGDAPIYKGIIEYMHNACPACEVANASRKMTLNKYNIFTTDLCEHCPIVEWRGKKDADAYNCNLPGRCFNSWAEARSITDSKNYALIVTGMEWYSRDEYVKREKEEFGINVYSGEHRVLTVLNNQGERMKHELIQMESFSAHQKAVEPAAPVFREVDVKITLRTPEQLAWFLSIINYSVPFIKKMNTESHYMTKADMDKIDYSHVLWQHLDNAYKKYLSDLHQYQADLEKWLKDNSEITE